MTENTLVGKTLDNLYKIEALIGQGGMGDVYKATHIILGDLVAIKVMPPDKNSTIEDKKRFLREGKAARKFNHTNAITVHDLRESNDGIAYMVMEYVEGRNLREEMNEKKCFSIEETLSIIEPVASALSEAHAMGVVHRDIKPENIMIGRVGDKTIIKLLDLGVAKLIDEKTILTIEGQQLGTPYYMSPEQWGMVSQADPDKILEVDGRSDIYSLAVIIYEMVTGQRPFTGKTLQELAIQHITATPISIDKLNPTVPIRFSQVVAQAMAKEPKDRPTDCQELITGLHNGVSLQEPNLLVTEKNIVIDTNSENYNGQKLDVKVKNTNDKYLIAGLATIGVLVLLGLGLYTWQNTLQSVEVPNLNVITPLPTVLSTPIVNSKENTEIMGYWVKVVAKDGTVLRKAKDIILSNEEKIQLHFNSRQIGYLYLIITGRDSNLTTILTSKPIVQTGIDSNLISEGEDFAFPNSKQLIKMGGNSTNDKVIVIFAPLPIKTLPFLDKTAGYTLNEQEQSLLANLRAKSVTNKFVLKTENDIEMAVSTKEQLKDDECLVFDIDIAHNN